MGGGHSSNPKPVDDSARWKAEIQMQQDAQKAQQQQMQMALDAQRKAEAAAQKAEQLAQQKQVQQAQDKEAIAKNLANSQAAGQAAAGGPTGSATTALKATSTNPVAAPGLTPSPLASAIGTSKMGNQFYTPSELRLGGI